MTSIAVMAPTSPQRGPARSTRTTAIERAVTIRALHRELAAEFSSTTAPGRVLAVAVRCSRALERGGCSAEQLPAATRRLVRAALLG